MILLLIGFVITSAAVIGVLIASSRSKKSVKQLYAEAKYEIIYNIIGAASMIDDMRNKKRNKTELVSNVGCYAVITGGTRGIGVEVIKMLLQCDVNVIVGCRKIEAGERVFQQIRNDGIRTGDVKVFELDTSSLKSVQLFADKINESYDKLNILINNAGIMYVPYKETLDGYESQFATNYLGHSLLTHMLLPLLEKGGNFERKSRIVNVASCAYLTGTIRFENINNKENYIPFEAYSQSKLAQILFSNQLNKSLNKSNRNVQSYSLHPGVVNTDLFQDTYIKLLVPWACRLFFKTPKEGAMTIIHTAISEQLENKGGTYVSNCQIQNLKEFAVDERLQEKLFDFTADLLGIKNFCNRI